MAIHIPGVPHPPISNPPPVSIQNQGISPGTNLRSVTPVLSSPKTAPAHVLHLKNKDSSDPVGENGEDAPLSRDELKQLYRISNRLNLKDLDDLVMVLGTLDFVDRRYFLDLAHGSDTDIVSLVRRVEALGPKDVSHFLSVALKLGSGEDLEAFGRSVDVLFGEERSAFLETALFLAQEGGPVDSAHFIRGAAGDLDQAGNLTDRVRSMAGDSQGRSLFLALAAVADKEVGRLLGTLDRFSDSATPFLEAAQGVSGGMGALLDLIQANSGEKNQELMDFLASLAFDDRDNFLLSTRGEGPRMDRLIFLASPMEAHGKSAFFAVASRGDQDHLLVLLEKMDASDRDNLVLAARTAGDRAGELMALMDELKGDQQTQVLAFASGLSHHDLENFLTGARGEDAAAIAAVGEGLGEKALSYFLYALDRGGIKGDQLIRVIQTLEETEQEDLLFMAANGGVDTDFLDRLEGWKGEGRGAYLADQRSLMEKTGRAKVRQEFIYLNTVLEDGLFEKIVDTLEDFPGWFGDLGAMGGEQRELVLSLAKKAAPRSMVPLAQVTKELEGEAVDGFLSQAHSLAGEDLDHFVLASQISLSKGDNSRFNQLLGFTRSLTGGMRSAFLRAAGNAGEDLGRFMEMTKTLGGENRGHFIRAAAQVADKKIMDLPLMGFLLETSELVFQRAEKGYLRVREIYGSRPSQIHAMEMPATAIRSGFLGGYFRSAAWLSAQEVSTGHMADWFNSFRGIPLTYMDSQG